MTDIQVERSRLRRFVRKGRDEQLDPYNVRPVSLETHLVCRYRWVGLTCR
jgi:uncharacterized protein with von Willebrand factor type A (vWA) domain